MTPPWMLLRLAIETRNHHSAADDDRLALMDVETRSEYRSFLVSIFGFESAVEDALLRVTGLDIDVLRGRLRAEHLKQDLATLGLDGEAVAWLPRFTTVPIRTAPQALGWLFVLERSSLMAGILRRHVERRLRDSVVGAVQYLATSGDNPGARLRVLGECLDRYADRFTPGVIVAAANEAFRAQRQWYASFRRVSARGTEAGQSPVLKINAPVATDPSARVAPPVQAEPVCHATVVRTSSGRR